MEHYYIDCNIYQSSRAVFAKLYKDALATVASQLPTPATPTRTAASSSALSATSSASQASSLLSSLPPLPNSGPVAPDIARVLALPHAKGNDAYSAMIAAEAAHITSSSSSSSSSSSTSSSQSTSTHARPFVLVIDNPQRLVDVDEYVLPALARLGELSGRPSSIILITSGLWPAAACALDVDEVVRVHFAAYSEAALVDILANDIVQSNPVVPLSTRCQRVLRAARRIMEQMQASSSSSSSSSSSVSTSASLSLSNVYLSDIAAPEATRGLISFVVASSFHVCRDILELRITLRSLLPSFVHAFIYHVYRLLVNQLKDSYEQLKDQGQQQQQCDIDAVATKSTTTSSSPSASASHIRLPWSASLPAPVLVSMRQACKQAIASIYYHESPVDALGAPHYLDLVEEGEDAISIDDSVLRHDEAEEKRKQSLSTSLSAPSTPSKTQRAAMQTQTPTQSQSQQQSESLALGRLNLPPLMKGLVIAAALASYCNPKDDVRLFSAEGAKRARRASTRAPAGASRVSVLANALLGPKPFPLERLLAIFHAIGSQGFGGTEKNSYSQWGEGSSTPLSSRHFSSLSSSTFSTSSHSTGSDAPSLREFGIGPALPFGPVSRIDAVHDHDAGPGISYDTLLNKVSSIVELGLVAYSQANKRLDPLDSSTRLVCNVPLDEVRALAEKCSIDIDLYLSGGG